MAFELQSALTDHQVVQCDEHDTATLHFAGIADGKGSIEARVVAPQKEVLAWTRVGESAGSTWRGALPGVPVGGPYRIDVRFMAPDGNVERTAVHDVLVGDLWVLAGQSNMQGVGDRYDEEEPHPQVHTFAMSYEWRLAQKPLHTLHESPDPVHHDAALTEAEREAQVRAWRDGSKGAGLGLTFAKEMLRRTGRPVGLIAAAHGGTSMAQWDPALKDEGGNSLYGSMCKQVEAAGGRVRGVLWYQGESDAAPDAAPVFAEKFRALVAAMRRDFHNPGLPFYYVQIGRVATPWQENEWNRIQTDQLAAESAIPNTAMVAAVDLDMDDLIHIGTPGLKVLGTRLANLAEAGLYGGTVLPGPRFEKMERLATPYGVRLRLTFRGVNGALTGAGRLHGFSISQGPDGDNTQAVHKVMRDPENPHALLVCVSELPEAPHLWYGRGLDPYCNITDEANMALPVFGPVKIPR